MQAEITFSENTIGTKAESMPKILQTIKLVQKLRKFIDENNWDERLPRYEKYINRFSWTIIITAVIYLTPICISIFIR